MHPGRNHPCTPNLRRPASLLMCAVAVALTVAGCGGNGGGTKAADQPKESKGTAVMVTETEFKVVLSTSNFAPGTYTFVVEDKGRVTHALSIDGPGVEDKTTGSLAPGKSGSVTVTLKKGTYTLYCPIGNHKSQGMKADIKVG